MEPISTSTKTNRDEEQLKRALAEGTTLDAQERVCTVDEHNMPTSTGHLRSEMRLNNMWHRATYIIVRHIPDRNADTNFDDAISKSEDGDYILVQRRSKLKDYCPNALDPAPGGVVGFGESYLDNAQREMEEEMGISTKLTPDLKPNQNQDQNSDSHLMQRLFTFSYKDDRVKCWGDLYEVQYTGPLSKVKLQEEEVQEVLSLSLTQVKSMIKQQPDEWMPDGLHALRLYLQYRNDVRIKRNLMDEYSGSNFKAYTLRPKPKVIFFDCDDCLYFDHWKTANALTQSIGKWCTEKMGMKPGEPYALYKKYGTCLKGLLAENYIENTPHNIQQCLKDFHDIPIHTLIQPDPKLRKILERLDPTIPKFVFTASVKHHAERCLKALGIDHLFPSDHIIDVISCNLETKHCRESFQIAMKIANVTEPESCLFFDDSVKNIQVGRTMGWRSVLVGKVGRDCGTVIGSDDAELEMNSIHDIENCFPECFP